MAEESKYGAIFADEAQDFNEIVRQYEEAYKRDPMLDVQGDRNDAPSSSSKVLSLGNVVKASVMIGVSVLVAMAVMNKTGTSDVTSVSTVDSLTPSSAVDVAMDVPVIPSDVPDVPSDITEYVPDADSTEPSAEEGEGEDGSTEDADATSTTTTTEDAAAVTTVTDANPLTFKVMNHAYPDSGSARFAYPFLESAHLMEPYRQNTVYVTGVAETCTVAWMMKGLDSKTGDSKWVGDQVQYDATAGAHTFAVLPKVTGKYSIEVQEVCADAFQRSAASTVWVKYVRRELSSLNGADREEFLDALKTLWDVNTREGIEKYGINYKSLNYLAVMHNDGSGNGVCDEFQTGAGFVNNQVLLSMYLEQSLRLVNPRVSLHYMEYSKYFESAEFKTRSTNLDGGEWNLLMSDTYFGKSDPVTGKIVDSRWAETPVPRLTTEFYYNEVIDESTTFFPTEEATWKKINPAHVTSPYGLLRAPWNYNPDAFLTRYNNVDQVEFAPLMQYSYNMYAGTTCADVKEYVQSYVSGQTMQTMLENMETSIATKFYASVGGSGGGHAKSVDDQLRMEFGITDDELMAITRGGQALYKNYIPRKNAGTAWYPLECANDPWQAGTLTTSAAPGEQASPENGGLSGPWCQCNKVFQELDANLTALIGLWNMKDSTFLYDLDIPKRTECMNLLCGRMSYDGELATSASAVDPLFWVGNGAVERLYQQVLFSGALKDTTYVNSKRNECSGHTADGKKAWLKGLYFQDESVDPSTLTNTQLAGILDPTSDKYRDYLNYVYDDASWSWCSGFDDWFTSSSTSSSSSGSGAKMKSSEYEDEEGAAEEAVEVAASA